MAKSIGWLHSYVSRWSPDRAGCDPAFHIGVSAITLNIDRLCISY
jgi:hypothetical protein